MATSDTNRTQLCHLKETSFGVAPTGSRAMQEMRITGESFQGIKDTTESQELRSDRALAELLVVGQAVKWSFDAELSYGHFDPWLQNIFGSVFTDAAGKAVTGAAATDLFTSAGHGWLAGDIVVFSSLVGGAGLVAGARYYVLAAGLTPDAFKVSATDGGAALDLTTDLTAGTATRSDLLRNGVTVPSYLFLRRFLDTGIDHYFTGCKADELALTVEAKKPVMLKVSGMGTFAGSGDAGSPIPFTPTITPRPTLPPIITAGARVGPLSLNGAPFTAQGLRKLELGIKANLREKPVVTSLYSDEFGTGDWRATLKPEFYYTSRALHALFESHTALSFGFRLGDLGANSGAYDFLFPRLQAASSNPSAGKKNDDVVQPLEWVATYDATLAAMARIIRTAGS